MDALTDHLYCGCVEDSTSIKALSQECYEKRIRQRLGAFGKHPICGRYLCLT